MNTGTHLAMHRWCCPQRVGVFPPALLYHQGQAERRSLDLYCRLGRTPHGSRCLITTLPRCTFCTTRLLQVSTEHELDRTPTRFFTGSDPRPSRAVSVSISPRPVRGLLGAVRISLWAKRGDLKLALVHCVGSS